jgi:DNA-binding GntR family transcriptional regulator
VLPVDSRQSTRRRGGGRGDRAPRAGDVARPRGRGAAGRHLALTRAIDAGDDPVSIRAELELHGLVYETAGHGLLLRAWQDLRGRLQLYWAAHHRAHGTRGPRRDAHDSYVAAALGEDLAAMVREVEAYMRRGLETTDRFLRAVEAAGTVRAADPERKGEGG